MPTKTCVFEIQSAGGGDLKGDMFGKTTGKLTKAAVNKFKVVVVWNDGALPPPSITGRFMVSAAPTAATSQASASPFRDSTGNKQLCYFEQRNVAGVVDGTGRTQYTFDEVPVHQNAEIGKYELTFVAESEDAAGNVTGTQWSEDPEFDVDG